MHRYHDLTLATIVLESRVDGMDFYISKYDARSIRSAQSRVFRLRWAYEMGYQEHMCISHEEQVELLRSLQRSSLAKPVFLWT
jgi:hypothetical protein